MFEELDDLTTWDRLKVFGSNRILQSTYVWLFVVPTLAKALETVRSPVRIMGDLTISIDLPFSWLVFYCAAIFIVIGNLIYYFRCPDFIKRASNFTEWKESQMPLHTLEHSIQQIIDQEIKIGKIDSEPVLSNEHDKYWYLLRRFREQSRLARMVCGSAYALGILGIVWVLLENAFFVFRFVFF